MPLSFSTPSVPQQIIPCSLPSLSQRFSLCLHLSVPKFTTSDYKVLRSTHYLKVVTFQNFLTISSISIFYSFWLMTVLYLPEWPPASVCQFLINMLKKKNNQNYDYRFKYLTMHIKTIFEYLVNDFLALEDIFFLTFYL